MNSAADRLSAQIVADEVPLLMRVAGWVILLFDAGGVAIGSGKHPQFLLLDLLVLIGLLALARAIERQRIPVHRAPWSFALASSVVIAVLLLAAWFQPGPTSLGFPLLFVATYLPIVTAQRPALCTAPVVVAMGSATASHIHGGFDADWTALFLGAAVTGGMLLQLRLQMVERLATAQESTERLAQHDALTGVLNRRGFDSLMKPSIATERRAGTAMFAAFIDIDGLKSVNDSEGHERGDEVIRRVAHALQSVTRPGDLVARFGGDEFIVIGPGGAPDPDRLRSRIEQHAAQPAPVPGWVGTVSVGTYGAVGADISVLVGGADAAMYARRKSSR